jgi:hypothetical protein
MYCGLKHVNLKKNTHISNIQLGVISIPDMPLELHHYGSSPSPLCRALLVDLLPVAPLPVLPLLGHCITCNTVAVKSGYN